MNHEKGRQPHGSLCRSRRIKKLHLLPPPTFSNAISCSWRFVIYARRTIEGKAMKMKAMYTECKVPTGSQFVKLSCCSVTFAEETRPDAQRGFLCSPNSPRLDITPRDRRLFETSLRPSLDSLVGFIVIELEYESVDGGRYKRAVQCYNVTKQCRRWPGISTSRYSDAEISALKEHLHLGENRVGGPGPHPRPVKSPNHSRSRSSLNELLAANAVAERSKLSRPTSEEVHRHASHEIVVLSRDLAATNEGVHGSHLPSSLPLYKLHDDLY
ncbi:hypothetical protein DBV15_01614 [Temnothorax longispinosus]|uniref:Uncharacterized protein n=1 Tax=Temnothorax longispinosus TaxID=300112 RepID=A0A4S2KTP7_9HYME|nr:hypothetical protein DBV15_01614 [Temnothorax longispinosus]